MKTKITDKKYYIDTYKRTVVCVIKWKVEELYAYFNKIGYLGTYESEYETKGKAKCLPEDSMDITLGQRLAEKRALIKGYKKAAKYNNSFYQKIYKELEQINADKAKYMSLEDDEIFDEARILESVK